MRYKKKIILIFCLSVFYSFGQKKELKAVEKALKSKNFLSAKENLIVAEKYDFSNVDLKTKVKYHYLKGVAYYAEGEASFVDSKLSLENFEKVILFEKKSKSKTYTEKVKSLKIIMLNKFIENAKNSLELKDYYTSYSNLEYAFRVSPSDTLYLYNAALLATESKDFDVAMRFYSELEDLAFTGVTTNYYAVDLVSGEEQSFATESNRNLFVKAGSHKDPRNELTESVELNVFRSMAAIHKNNGDRKNALLYINKAKEINPNDINLILLESNIQWELGDVKLYKKLISRALEINPSNADLLFNLGVVSADNDDIENAKMYYDKAISVNPNYTKAYLNIAALILSQEEGIIEEMNSLGTSNADYNRYDDLQDIRNNIYQEAIPYLETILSIENDNINAARTLRNIFSAVGDEVNYKLMKEKVEELEN
jgi:tetratricopeptide (TPR) repeat protein